MSRIRSVALVSAAALLAAVLVAPPAVADRYTESDPPGDMAKHILDPPETSAAPNHHKLDIRHVVVRHTDDVVSIRAVVRHLTRPRGEESFTLSGFVKINPHYPSEWAWYVNFDEDHPRKGGQLWVLDAAEFETTGCLGTDDGLRARANYVRNRVTVIIPRGCFATNSGGPSKCGPKWVQVSVGTQHILGLDRASWLDALGAVGQQPLVGLENAHFTPRLYAS